MASWRLWLRFESSQGGQTEMIKEEGMDDEDE